MAFEICSLASEIIHSNEDDSISNSEVKNQCSVSVGIDCGPVTIGLVGTVRHFKFGVFGLAQDESFRISRSYVENGIYCSSRVKDIVSCFSQNAYTFEFVPHMECFNLKRKQNITTILPKIIPPTSINKNNQL